MRPSRTSVASRWSTNVGVPMCPEPKSDTHSNKNPKNSHGQNQEMPPIATNAEHLHLSFLDKILGDQMKMIGVGQIRGYHM